MYILLRFHLDATALRTAVVHQAQLALPVALHLAFCQHAMCQAAEAPKYDLNSTPMQGGSFQNQKDARLQYYWIKSPYASCKKH